MKIDENRIEVFEPIAESFIIALSHSRVSIESLGELATLLYLIKHGQLYKAYNIDAVEGDNLFVLQYSPSMIAGDMERWMREGIGCIGMMRKQEELDLEMESIIQQYRSSMRLHQNQEALLHTCELIMDAQLEANEYSQLLAYSEQILAKHFSKDAILPIYPASLGEIAVGLLHNSTQTVYDPHMGGAAFSSEVDGDTSFYGVEINPNLYNYSVIKLALSGKQYRCFLGKPTKADFQNISADCIVTFPPLMPKDHQGLVEEAIRLFVDHEQFKELIIIVDEYILSSDKYHDLRKELTDKNMLEHVLKLPNNYLFNTQVAPSILHLRKERNNEEEAIFYNLSENADKKGRRMDISVASWLKIVESDYNESIYGSFRHSAEQIAAEDYDWSCDAYPLDTFVTGIPYGGDLKPFKQMMKRYDGQPITECPEKVLSFVSIDSPLDTPRSIAPRETKTDEFVRVTEPVFVVGYSNKCSLYYLEASEENPAYLSKRDILYQCVDSLVNPMFLACSLSKSIDRTFLMEEYIYTGTIFPNKRINKFLRAQRIGLPSFPVQMARVAEWKDAYLHEQLKDTKFAQYVDTIKQQYIAEVRSRKHNMRPFLREIKSSINIARLFVEKATSLDDLKDKLLPLLESIESNGEGLANIIERLSQEEKFEDAEYLDVEQAINECVDYYKKNTEIQFTVAKLSDSPWAEPFDPDNSPTWGKYALCSSYDFRRMFNAIVENARVHGFEGNDEGHNIDITIDYDEEHFKIGFRNDGLPFPDGFDIHQYGLLGGKAGKHAGTGDGGHQVVSIVDHFGGWVEIKSSKPGALIQYAEVIVYLRVLDKDYDDSL